MRINRLHFYNAGITILLFSAYFLFILIADIKLILTLIPDDAAYYFKIAENYYKGYGFSFDTIHQTNGFQPLWQYIMIILYYFNPADPETFTRTALILQVILSSASGIILFNVVFKNKGKTAALVTHGIFLFLVFSQTINGMESAILVFILIIFYRSSVNSETTFSSNFVVGILGGLLILARIDFFTYILIFIITLFIRKEFKPASGMLLGFILISLPYGLNNYLATGHFEPVTGVLKSSFPHITLKFDTQFTFTAFLSIYLALFASVFYVIYSFKNVVIKRIEKPFLFVLAAAIIVHYTFYLLFTKWAVLNYYFLFYGVFLSIFAAEFIKTEKLKSAAFVISGISLLFIFIKIAINLNKNIENSWHAGIYDAAVWAKQNTSADEIFAMKDAGNFAFFSERKVINLDGLVNDFRFQEFLLQKRLNLYLRKNKVAYYVLYKASAPELWKGEYEKYEESFMSYMYMQFSDRISVMKEGEIYRKTFAGDSNPVLIIWKMR